LSDAVALSWTIPLTFAPSAGFVMETVGGVLSIRIVIETVVVCGKERVSLFVAVHVKTVVCVRVTGPHPLEDLMPEEGSVTRQLTFTSLRYQPSTHTENV